MKQIAKMVVVNFGSYHESKLEEFPQMLELYKNNSSYMTEKESYWNIPRPDDISYESWIESCKDTEYLKKYLDENKIFNSFSHTFELYEYNEFDFYNYKLKTYNITNRFEVPYTPITGTSDVERALALIHTNISLFDKQLEGLKNIGEQHYNLKCNTPVTDNFLSKINQIMLLENCCSDELQNKLSEGWRIISVAPQPNQRRPDYVLGKVVDEPTKSALRY